MFPVDVVYTWVDGNNPEHQQKLAEVSGEKAYCRFANNNELFYSLSSIYQHAPWVRKIFIVVADYQQLALEGLPSALTDKIVRVAHSQIMPEEALPSFSSRAIEASLYKIPDLSEHFIYFNDDMFFGSKVSSSDFFSAAGEAYCLLDLRHLACWRWNLLAMIFPRDYSYMQARKLIYRQHKGKFFKFCLPYHVALHQCYPCKKSLFESMYAKPKLHKALNAAVFSRLRNYKTVIPVALMQFYGLTKGGVLFKRFKEHLYFEVKGKVPFAIYRKALACRPKLLCMNNELKKTNIMVEESINNFLKAYFNQ